MSPSVPRIFPQETNTNYEVGIKGSLHGKRPLSYAISVYHTQFHNQVFFFIVPGTSSRIILPIARSRINGGEVELNWYASKQLTFNLGASYSDAIIENADVPVNGEAQAYSGNAVPGTNKYQVNASLEYTVPVTFGDLYGRIGYARRGPIKYDLANQFGYQGVNLVDLRVGGRSGQYDFSVYVNNATDARYPLFFQNDLIGNGENGLLANLPRMFGAELRMAF